ncbi:MAG: hypothetical protein LBL76_00775 [Treponema sp.]|nr:hypothetical protein [Treponema sp.]
MNKYNIALTKFLPALNQPLSLTPYSIPQGVDGITPIGYPVTVNGHPVLDRFIFYHKEGVFMQSSDYNTSAMECIKITGISVLSIIVFLAITGVIMSCTTSKNKENNKILVQTELNLLMFQIKNKIINLDTLSDQEYIDVAHKFVTLINSIGKIKSSKEHYFRNYFSRAPQTLDEMVKIIMNKEDNIFEWELLPWQKMAFHMYGKDGDFMWNNTPEAMAMSKEASASQPIDKNDEAMKRYKAYEK